MMVNNNCIHLATPLLSSGQILTVGRV